MKFYSLILLFILITFINSKCSDVKGTKASDCQNKLSDNEKEKGYSYCCYVKATTDEGCARLTKDSYNNIKKAIKDLETERSLEIKSLDCHSLFLKFGLVNILLFLL